MSDGNIVLARKKLSESIHDLINQQPKTILRDNGHVERQFIPSRYQHLVDSIGGQMVEAKGGGQARLPVWADVVDCITDIDTTVCSWSTKNTGDTVSTLIAIDDHAFRPQDTDMINGWTSQINLWCRRIDTLLNPEPTKEVLAPCPNCQRRWVYRRHAGEEVRQAALQIVSHLGCRCLACNTAWPPSRFLFLCRVLGFELPAGVQVDE